MKINNCKAITAILFVSGMMTGSPVLSHAGLFDALNNAANKLNQAAQQIDQGGGSGQSASNGSDPDHPVNLQYKGSCEGHRSATCMDYNEGMDQCMAPIRGYRMKMLGDRIEYKFKNEKLTDQQRKSLQEDLTGAREAQKKGSDDPTIAGEAKSQRYLSDISDEDQIWVNAEFGRLRNKIYNKCMGADHMQTGHRTEMITDMGPTGDEAVAQYRKEHPQRRRGSYVPGAGVSGGSGGAGCDVQTIAGLRYNIMADMMEKKMQSLKLSDKEKVEWLMDIGAVRTVAQTGGMSMPTVPDPKNPYRPITRLSSPEEQTALNNEYVKQSQACRGH